MLQSGVFQSFPRFAAIAENIICRLLNFIVYLCTCSKRG